MKSWICRIFLTVLCCPVWAAGSVWKTGEARIVITPADMSVRMGGYAHRTHGAEGKLHDLWVKALAVEDVSGRRGVIVTSDLLGIPKNVSDEIRAELKTRYGLLPAQVILNSSHTHSAPIVYQSLWNCYVLDDREKTQIETYKNQLVASIIEVVGEALAQMKPSKIYSGIGVVRFQVNRRNNTEKTLSTQDELRGPNDYAVNVLKVAAPDGTVKAVLFGYACHPTTLDGYFFSGDWPGFAQIEIEKRYPGASAMFVQGAAADLNPLPRRSIPLAVQYGKEITAAVECVMSGQMNELSPELTVAYREFDLPFGDLPTDTELRKDIASFPNTDYRRVAAQWVLDRQRQGEALPASYPYPIQLWRMGAQNIFTFGGELSIQYAINVKRKFGYDAFVLGYTNDLMGYIPSERILQEGGYEGKTSQAAYGLHTVWAAGIEQHIMEQVRALAAEAGLNLVE